MDQNFAIKLIKGKHIEKIMEDAKSMYNEAQILLQLNHPNIIKIYELKDNGVYTKKDSTQNINVFYSVLECAKNGEIFGYLSYGGPLPEPIARFYFKQLIAALDHCHRSGFCHRDLKPENLLLDENFNLKVADFGFSKVLCGSDGTGRLRTECGSHSYMAPEIFRKTSEYYGVQVDTFSAAVILFIFMVGTIPFNEANPSVLLYKLICSNRHTKFWKHWIEKTGMSFSPDLQSLLNSMFCYDPTHRPSISEIITSSWWNGPTATPQEVKLEFENRKVLVLEKEEEERQQREDLKAQCIQENGNHNFAKDGILANRNRELKGLGGEDCESIDTVWDEVSAKIAEQNSMNSLSVYYEGSVQPGTKIYSNLDADKFL
jgi:serine/threonine protein kinase